MFLSIFVNFRVPPKAPENRVFFHTFSEDASGEHFWCPRLPFWRLLGSFLAPLWGPVEEVKIELPLKRELNFGSWREALESPGASPVHVFGDLAALLFFVTFLCVNLEKVSKTPGVSSVEVLKPTRYLNFQSENAINTW